MSYNLAKIGYWSLFTVYCSLIIVMVQIASQSTNLNLKDLEKLLQNRLYSEPLQLVPLQIRCVLKEQTLTVIINHPEPVLAHPRAVFRLVRQMLEDEKITCKYSGLIYLRINGQKRPYLSHSIKIKSLHSDESNPLDNEINSDPQFLQFSNAIESETEPTLNHPFSFDIPITNTDDQEPSQSEDNPSIFDFQSVINDDQTSEPPDQIPNFTEPEIDFNNDFSSQENQENQFESMENEVEEDEENQFEIKRQKFLKKTLILGITSVIAVVGGTFYILTRPCVMNKCDAMAQAQEYASISKRILKQNPSGSAIFDAQKQLNDAISLLEKIPQWSFYHSEAKSLLNRYQDQAQTLDNLINALKIASQVASQTQKPPFSVQQWQKIQQDWRKAISRLETIKSDSDLYLLAQSKITDYKKNLNMVNARLNEEAQAVEKLKIAQEAIKVAQVRQGTAQSLDNWQLVYATWQTAMSRLKEIAPSTTVYGQAQTLINDYSATIADVRDKKNQELFAVNAYNQALRLAQLAKNAQTIKQWSNAVYQWRNASDYLKQVPQNSFQYNQVQPLLNAYQNALIQAENQLRKSIKFQQAQEDLTQTCQGVAKVCDFTITDSIIKVKLTPEYVQDIRQTALKAKTQGNSNTEIALLDHISTLEQALQVISNNTKLRVEVYEPNNSLAIAYMPKQ